ncbi:MAG TPA: DUF5076 domain-containing protein [Isosphaeraceae bacterium]
MSSHPNQLDIPDPAVPDPKAFEIIRIWAGQGKQLVTIRTELWDDPAAWGMMLVDLAHHVANAYEQIEGRDRVEVLARLRQGFDAEWADQTDTPIGRVSG